MYSEFVKLTWNVWNMVIKTIGNLIAVLGWFHVLTLLTYMVPKSMWFFQTRCQLTKWPLRMLTDSHNGIYTLWRFGQFKSMAARQQHGEFASIKSIGIIMSRNWIMWCERCKQTLNVAAFSSFGLLIILMDCQGAALQPAGRRRMVMWLVILPQIIAI